jgi:UPF0716 protein FxsA
MPALLLLILWPVAELFVAIEVARSIGVLLTVLLLVLGWPVGLWLMRAEGRSAWRRLSLAVAEGRRPAGEAIDGALVLLGGLLLIVPGFITDALGLCLLLAPTRRLARAVVVRNFQSRLVLAATRMSRRPGAASDVDSTASDLDRERLAP